MVAQKCISGQLLILNMWFIRLHDIVSTSLRFHPGRILLFCFSNYHQRSPDGTQPNFACLKMSQIWKCMNKFDYPLPKKIEAPKPRIFYVYGWPPHLKATLTANVFETKRDRVNLGTASETTTLHFENLMNSGPQMPKNRTAVYTHPQYTASLPAFMHTVSSINIAPYNANETALCFSAAQVSSVVMRKSG